MKNNYLVPLLMILHVFVGNLVVAADTAVADETTVLPANQSDSTPDTDDIATTVPEVPPTEEEIELKRTISRYAEQVRRLEMENGIYNNDLVEELIGMGRAYSNFGNHAEALKIYERAMHINRINEGLHNLNQLSILELIIEANTALNNYVELTDNYDYMLWVYSRNYPQSYDPGMLPIIDRVANWHLQAYDMTAPPESVKHLLTASDLFRKSFVLLQSITGPDDPRLLVPLNNLFKATSKLVERFGFLSSQRVQELYYAFGGMPDELRNIYYVPKEFNRDDLYDFIKLEHYTLAAIQNSFVTGRDVMYEIIQTYEIHPELPRQDYARALLQLADWYIKFEQRKKALSVYNQAYQLLAETSYDDINAVEESLSDQHPLGTMVLGPGNIAESATNLANKTDLEIENYLINDLQDKSFIIAEFDISTYGVVNNFEIIQSNPDNTRFRSAIKKKIPDPAVPSKI